MDQDDFEQIIVPLDPDTEWRFELEQDEDLAVRIHTPEPVYINSEELPPVSWYPLFRHTKGAIYAPQGGRLEVSSLPSSQYTSTSTIQHDLVSVHYALERERILARRALAANGSGSAAPPRGPRVMVVGPPSSGKTTVAKSLVNMALGARTDGVIGVVGLDPSSPGNLIPGSLSLSTPSHPIPSHHLAHPFGPPPASMPASTLAADVPTLGWWYGGVEPTTRGAPLWTKIVQAMGDAWRRRCEKDPMAVAAGLIMDTSSAFANATLGTRKDDPKARYTLLVQAVEAFDIDTILVIGHEKLTVDLDRLFSPRLRVVRVPKSGGVVDLDDHARELAHAWQVRTYFHGEPVLPRAIATLVGRQVPLGNQLSPYSFQIGWETLHVLRVGEEHAAPSTALPLGSSRILSQTRLTRVDPSGPAHITRLLNAVLAIVAITPDDRLAPKPAKAKAEPAPAVKTEDAKPEAEAGDADAAAKAEPADAGAEVKQEGVAGEAQPDAVKEEGEAENADVVDDIAGEVEEDEDEVPFREDIGWRQVLGFIVITGIDTQRKKYTVLSPSPGKLPSTIAIAGSIEWVDMA